MKVVSKYLSVDAKADVDIKDITGAVQDAVTGSEVKNGTVTVFVPGSTGSVSTLEYEPGLLKDIPRALERLAPSGMDYAHHQTWHDDNGKSHVRATIIGPSLVVPIIDGRVIHGTWQQIVFMNLDTSARRRDIVLQIMGE
ncbi:MAG: secondary thiamine-phosphate synthase enzyme YjbQ [Candidatus Hydrothermarchaeaceae archaeon]